MARFLWFTFALLLVSVPLSALEVTSHENGDEITFPTQLEGTGKPGQVVYFKVDDTVQVTRIDASGTFIVEITELHDGKIQLGYSRDNLSVAIVLVPVGDTANKKTEQFDRQETHAPEPVSKSEREVTRRSGEKLKTLRGSAKPGSTFFCNINRTPVAVETNSEGVWVIHHHPDDDVSDCYRYDQLRTPKPTIEKKNTIVNELDAVPTPAELSFEPPPPDTEGIVSKPQPTKPLPSKKRSQSVVPSASVSYSNNAIGLAVAIQNPSWFVGAEFEAYAGFLRAGFRAIPYAMIPLTKRGVETHVIAGVGYRGDSTSQLFSNETTETQMVAVRLGGEFATPRDRPHGFVLRSEYSENGVRVAAGYELRWDLMMN